jgi:hypothetical protein
MQTYKDEETLQNKSKAFNHEKNANFMVEVKNK